MDRPSAVAPSGRAVPPCYSHRQGPVLASAARARRQQQVMAAETGMASMANPLGGSFGSAMGGVARLRDVVGRPCASAASVMPH